MILTSTRTLALGGAILVTAGVAVATVPLVAGADGNGKGAGVEVEIASAAVPPEGGAPTMTAAAPDTSFPATPASAVAAPVAPPTTARAASRPAAHTTGEAAESGPAPALAPTPAAPAAPKLAPGQRLNPTSAQVQAAMATLHQRIPLFEPNESQLRTFADAVCTSLDQGQSLAQVESTVRDAVSRIQGASLSAADAAFAVGLMVQLRCPGYLP